jgi:FkbM family methyltransferase
MTRDQNLVFDVGLHKGEDTAFYLKKGFRVVSFEANPSLIAHCKNRFSDEIAKGQLTIMEGAIAPAEFGDRITFYESEFESWGTIMPNWESRNSTYGISSKVIEVNRVDILKAFESFGIPYFIKIDIEGADGHVLDCLEQLPARPQYISIESDKVSFKGLKSEFSRLQSLGYSKFKVVQQETIPASKIVTDDVNGNKFEYEFEYDGSGPFGEDIGQPWLSYEQAMSRYRKIFASYVLFGDKSVFRRVPGWWRVKVAIRWVFRRPLPGWYDTHASL